MQFLLNIFYIFDLWAGSKIKVNGRVSSVRDVHVPHMMLTLIVDFPFTNYRPLTSCFFFLGRGSVSSLRHSMLGTICTFFRLEHCQWHLNLRYIFSHHKTLNRLRVKVCNMHILHCLLSDLVRNCKYISRIFFKKSTF